MSWNCSDNNHPLFFLKKRNAEQARPSQQTHPLNDTPLKVYYDEPRPRVYDSFSSSDIDYTETVYRQQGSNDHQYVAPNYALGGFQDGMLLNSEFRVALGSCR